MLRAKRKVILHEQPDTNCYSLWNQVFYNVYKMKLNAHDTAAKLKVPLSTVLTYIDLIEGREPKAY